MNIHVEEGEAAGVLAGMASKGMIELWDGGYRPLLTSSQYCTAEIRDLVGQLYGGDTVAFLADYIDAAGPEERAALEDAFHKEGRQS